jgi:hypothetical protein
MEPLIFAVIAVRNGYKQEQSLVPEPDDFQPFDVRALGHVYNAKNDSSNRPSGRSPSLAARVAS